MPADGSTSVLVSVIPFTIHTLNAVILAEKTSGATTYMNATTDRGAFGTTTNHPLRLVAMKGRKTLGPVDIAAVLTKVAQAQQKFIREQQKINSELEKKIAELEKNSR